MPCLHKLRHSTIFSLVVFLRSDRKEYPHEKTFIYIALNGAVFRFCVSSNSKKYNAVVTINFP